MLGYLIGLIEVAGLVAVLATVTRRRTVAATMRDSITTRFGRTPWLLTLAPVYAAMFGMPVFAFGYLLGGLRRGAKLGLVAAITGIAFITLVAAIYPDDEDL